jgi:hypothetical protein
MLLSAFFIKKKHLEKRSESFHVFRKRSKPAQSRTIANSGVASGIAGSLRTKPIYDTANRPVTAGGFTAHGPGVFVGVTMQSGLATWQLKMEVSTKNYLVGTNGFGVCMIGFDNDG